MQLTYFDLNKTTIRPMLGKNRTSKTKKKRVFLNAQNTKQRAAHLTSLRKQLRALMRVGCFFRLFWKVEKEQLENENDMGKREKERKRERTRERETLNRSNPKYKIF